MSEGQAREDAREILSRPPFDPVEPPRPFRGVLRRLGDWLEPIGRPVGDLLESLTQASLFEPTLAVLALLAAAVVAARLVRGRTRAGVAGGAWARRRSSPGDDPDVLDRAADEAARTGDFAGAVRYRFRAGVLRLAAAGAIDLRPSLTTGAIARQVRSSALRDLARTFDAVVYGGRAASAHDAEAARDGWRRVLDEARPEMVAA